jgi:hypothetical protein
VNSSIKGFGRSVVNQIRGVNADYKSAIQNLKKATGTVASSPSTIAHSIATMFKAGNIDPHCTLLANSLKTSYTRPHLTNGRIAPPTKAILVSSIRPYNPALSNRI